MLLIKFRVDLFVAYTNVRQVRLTFNVDVPCCRQQFYPLNLMHEVASDSLVIFNRTIVNVEINNLTTIRDLFRSKSVV